MWEGIKTGAARVAEVIVSTVTEIAVWVGNAIVSLGELIINAIEQAVQAVEAVFQMIADAITRVIDWLKSLFSFGDIWNTKKALESGVATLMSYGVSTVEHYGVLADDWFQQKEAEVVAMFTALKAQYGGNAIGDFQNKPPQLQTTSGAQVDKSAVTENPQGSWMLNQAHGNITSYLRPAAYSKSGRRTPPLPRPSTRSPRRLQAAGQSVTSNRRAPTWDRPLKAFSTPMKGRARAWSRSLTCLSTWRWPLSRPWTP